MSFSDWFSEFHFLKRNLSTSLPKLFEFSAFIPQVIRCGFGSGHCVLSFSKFLLILRNYFDLQFLCIVFNFLNFTLMGFWEFLRVVPFMWTNHTHDTDRCVTLLAVGFTSPSRVLLTLGETTVVFFYLKKKMSRGRWWNLSPCFLRQSSHKLIWQLLQNWCVGLSHRSQTKTSWAHSLDVAMVIS